MSKLFCKKIDFPNNCNYLHLLYGGRGTEKSYLIKALYGMAQKMGIYVAFRAPKRIAACVLPEERFNEANASYRLNLLKCQAIKPSSR